MCTKRKLGATIPNNLALPLLLPPIPETYIIEHLWRKMSVAKCQFFYPWYFTTLLLSPIPQLYYYPPYQKPTETLLNISEDVSCEMSILLHGYIHHIRDISQPLLLPLYQKPILTLLNISGGRCQIAFDIDIAIYDMLLENCSMHTSTL